MRVFNRILLGMFLVLLLASVVAAQEKSSGFALTPKAQLTAEPAAWTTAPMRSEERRVGKECRL